MKYLLFLRTFEKIFCFPKWKEFCPEVFAKQIFGDNTTSFYNFPLRLKPSNSYYFRTINVDVIFIEYRRGFTFFNNSSFSVRNIRTETVAYKVVQTSKFWIWFRYDISEVYYSTIKYCELLNFHRIEICTLCFLRVTLWLLIKRITTSPPISKLIFEPGISSFVWERCFYFYIATYPSTFIKRSD